jgi:hypothetical protein
MTIKVEKIGKRQWKLLEDFRFVPAGFVTNGASVPRILWWFLDPATEAFEAAVIHDWALSVSAPKPHLLFLNTLKIHRVPWYKRYPAYWGVVVYDKLKGFIK